MWYKSKTFLILLLALAGVIVGTGVFTFKYAQGFSYFSSDPKACVNCHIMRDQYDSWSKSSHHAAATCVECHLPKSFFPKMWAKALNGYHHSKAFTLQNFHEPIMIKEGNARILQENCINCHGAVVHDLGSAQCVHCHLSVGHGSFH